MYSLISPYFDRYFTSTADPKTTSTISVYVKLNSASFTRSNIVFIIYLQLISLNLIITHGRNMSSLDKY